MVSLDFAPGTGAANCLFSHNLARSGHIFDGMGLESHIIEGRREAFPPPVKGVRP